MWTEAKLVCHGLVRDLCATHNVNVQGPCRQDHDKTTIFLMIKFQFIHVIMFMIFCVHRIRNSSEEYIYSMPMYAVYLKVYNKYMIMIYASLHIFICWDPGAPWSITYRYI